MNTYLQRYTYIILYNYIYICFCDMYSADVSESPNPWPMAYHVSALTSSDDA